MPNMATKTRKIKYMKLLKQLETTLQAGQVQRYHATPFVACQSIAEHSWNVTVIYVALCGAANITPDISGVMSGVMHDTAELYTGDAPFTVKRDYPEMKKMYDELEKKFEDKFLQVETKVDSEHSLLLKLADWLEGLRWCSHFESGNQKPILQNFARGIRNKWEAATGGNILFPDFPESSESLVKFLDGMFLKCLGEPFLEDIEGDATSAYVNQ